METCFGSVNPADIATREINLLSTSIKDEWFNRPQFLCSSESEWPSQEPLSENQDQYHSYHN